MSTVHQQFAILTWGGVTWTLFFLGYLLFANALRSQFGRALSVAACSVSVLIDLSLVAYWWGFHVPDWVATAIFILISLGGSLLLAVLASAQIRHRTPFRR